MDRGCGDWHRIPSSKNRTETAQTPRADPMKRFNCHSISNLVRYALRNKIIEIIEAELQNLRQRTRQACERAAVEQDPEKLHELIK
jgi:hypothetical protein